ncbi:MAG: monovalent cation:proton antiporter-2 (CPA2) family protein, partial [Paracoccaceae bacterium]|nr:monovalent cation:proton antiporter-2 (CPA2) family protein [Paracoccaceae bacterium]
MESFFYQATIFLAAAVIAVPISSRLGLGSVLGYLAAGIIIGPILGLVGAEVYDLRHFAEFGVVMMLFIVGLERDPRALWAMRHSLIGLGGLQITLTTLATMSAALAIGVDTKSALAIGLILALSSTAIVLQTLTEKGLMQTQGGRNTFSVLLTQDIAVIPTLAFLPLLAVAAFAVDDDADHSASMSLVEGLPGWGVTLVTLGAVAGVILAGVYLSRPIFRFIHSAHLREMYTALALMIVVGIAFLMSLVGLSPALGTFLAGVVLASSEFRHELESDLEPFKGLLLGLFFITVGAGINFALFFSAPFTIIGLSFGLILLKGAVLFGLAFLFKMRGRDKWLFTLSLAQAGEFGFVLVSFSQQQHVLTGEISEILLIVIAMTMLITPALFILYDWMEKRSSEHQSHHEPDHIDHAGPVIIAGIGRFGQIVNRLVQSVGYETVVLDHNMETIQLMRRFGFKGFFGDPTRHELLHAAGLMKAKTLVVALDSPSATLKLVEYARKERPDLHIIARARDRTAVFQLYQAGANDIIRELFDSSLRAG